MLPDVAAGRRAARRGGRRSVPFGLDENALAPVCVDFAADPHFMIFGDTECGKSNLLRADPRDIADPLHRRAGQAHLRRLPALAARLVRDRAHQIGYATSSVDRVHAAREVRDALVKRLPPPDLTPGQLRSRSWWSGADLFVIVDDYDLVLRPAQSADRRFRTAAAGPRHRAARDLGPVGRRRRAGDVRAGHPADPGDGLARHHHVRQQGRGAAARRCTSGGRCPPGEATWSSGVPGAACADGPARVTGRQRKPGAATRCRPASGACGPRGSRWPRRSRSAPARARRP